MYLSLDYISVYGSAMLAEYLVIYIYSHILFCDDNSID